MPDPTIWTPSTYAAWWGAVVATTALLWNIYRAARSGPRVKVTAKPDLQFFPRNEITGDKMYVYVTAVNHGDAPTTITSFAGVHAASFLGRFSKKRRQLFVIPAGPLGQPVPYVLRPGEIWNNTLEQQEQGDLAQRLRTGYVYIGVFHSRRKRPVYVRVRTRPEEKKAKPL